MESLRKWSDVRDLLDSGTLKQSTLDRALVKVGSYDNGELTLEQFMQLTDIIQRDMDATKLSESYEKKVAKQERQEAANGSASLGFKTSQESQVLRVPKTSTNEAETKDDEEEGMFDEVDELSEEEATREIFNELKGKNSNTLSLVDFIRWDDVQGLLASEALSKDDLASAIEKTGVTVENGQLTFENVS